MLVLASSSPRRRELLRNAGIRFQAHAADVDETRRPGEAPVPYATRLAREKAEAVATRYPRDLVLGADTVVIIGNEVLGKPVDSGDAKRMLQALAGNTHQVSTAVCLIARGRRFEQVETTSVFMTAIPERQIEEYVATGEPMDKAGAYAIQGGASRWIYRIEGDYSNVVGLPVAVVSQLLRAASGEGG